MKRSEPRNPHRGETRNLTAANLQSLPPTQRIVVWGNKLGQHWNNPFLWCPTNLSWFKFSTLLLFWIYYNIYNSDLLNTHPHLKKVILTKITTRNKADRGTRPDTRIWYLLYFSFSLLSFSTYHSTNLLSLSYLLIHTSTKYQMYSINVIKTISDSYYLLLLLSLRM